MSAGDDIVEALGATLIAGTSFSHPDYRGQTNVAMINETLAKRLSPIVPALGRTLATESFTGTIIGIVRDLVDSTPDVAAVPLVFQPSRGRSAGAHLLIVRTSSPADALLPLLRRTVETEFGPMKAYELRLLADDVDKTVEPWRGRAAMLGIVAALGLPLSIIGLASGMMFFVRARTRDIGIRLALGALPSQARAVVVTYARRIVGIGSAIGVGAGAVVGHLMSSQLFGVGAVSPVTTVAVALLIAGAAWVAAYVPARRASQVDPVVALRAE
jgi:ABC-type antimicrobial peptide transport system permease subunit